MTSATLLIVYHSVMLVYRPTTTVLGHDYAFAPRHWPARSMWTSTGRPAVGGKMRAIKCEHCLCQSLFFRHAR